MSDLKIFTENIEYTALEQINKLISLEVFKESKVRIMPDVHAGTGCVIGFTADLGDKVIPNIVGVDIGCGMTLPNDISRCSNERCEKKLKCKRYLDRLPWETYSYADFNEVDCKDFIENELKNDGIYKALH